MSLPHVVRAGATAAAITVLAFVVVPTTANAAPAGAAVARLSVSVPFAAPQSGVTREHSECGFCGLFG